MFTYDFGYSWWLVYGHLVPLALFGVLAAVSVWRRWRWWITAASGLVALWALIAFVIMQSLNRPVPLPSERFLAGGTGRVLDVGAGSGRLTVGVLQARPHATATALDIYSGYFGIEDNTPERLMANARAGGPTIGKRAAGRSEADAEADGDVRVTIELAQEILGVAANQDAGRREPEAGDDSGQHHVDDRGVDDDQGDAEADDNHAPPAAP